MSKLSLLKIAVALCFISILMSCQKDAVSEKEAGGIARLEVSVPVAETKLVSGCNETAIKNYQVFLFNDKNVLEAYVNCSSSDISLDCTLGQKTVVVLANAPSINDVTTLSALMAKKSSLSDNAADAFVMEGKVQITIETTEDVSVTVPVVRQVVKVELANVTTAFELAQYRDMSFKISSVYLINVAADKKYFSTEAPTLWLNQMSYRSSDDNLLIYDDMAGVEVTPSSPYSTKNAFYAYPNPTVNDAFGTTWTERHTRLVVETLLGSTKYYYPVTLPVLQQNKRYEVSLKITRPGSDTPDAVVDKFAADFEVTVKDWETGAAVSEEI